jgi:nicotinamidase-related amidase
MLLERAKSLLLLVDMQERLVPAMADAADVTARCGILLSAANALDVPVLASEQYPKGLGATIPDLAALAPRRLEKLEFSAYANSAIKDELARADRPQIVLAGVEAHVCVLQTGLELIAAGFQVRRGGCRGLAPAGEPRSGTPSHRPRRRHLDHRGDGAVRMAPERERPGVSHDQQAHSLVSSS